MLNIFMLLFLYYFKKAQQHQVTEPALPRERHAASNLKVICTNQSNFPVNKQLFFLFLFLVI